MYISCPECETTFSLPDELYSPGKKARCSQCGKVFPMPGLAPEPPAGDPAPGYGETAPPLPQKASRSPKQYIKAIIALVSLLLLLMLAYGGYLVYSSITAPPDDAAPQSAEGREKEASALDEQANAERERLVNSISLDEIRQFLVDNGNIGKVMVIQGQAVNSSPSNKDYITIEARIMDANNRTLAQVRQLCGVPLTLFQLQSLSETELKAILDNRITILTNNTNVPPGGKVPFVVVFPTPPANMRTFEVRVIDAQDSPPQ